MWTGKDCQLTNSIENNLFETLSLFLSLSLLLFHYRMSAVAALSLREAIIPLQQSFNACTMRAMRCASSTSLQGVAPGALVFGRDMLLNIPIVTDIISITENRQLQTDLRLERENRKRSHFDYQVDGKVYINNHFSSGDKLKPAWKGPYKILRVHTNGTLTVERGQIHERVSIRRCKPASA